MPGFSEEDAKRVSRSTVYVERLSKGGKSIRGNRKRTQLLGEHTAIVTETITARENRVFGSGQAMLQRIDSDSMSFEDDLEITVYNRYGSDVDPPRVIGVSFMFGKWWISGSDCSQFEEAEEEES